MKHIIFEEDYILLVIKPRVDQILEDGVASIAEFRHRFNKTFSCRISKPRITNWLKACGYKVTRRVAIETTNLSANPNPQPRGSTSPPTPPPIPQQEQFSTSHIQPSFHFTKPQGSVFANVNMPGFSD